MKKNLKYLWILIFIIPSVWAQNSLHLVSSDEALTHKVVEVLELDQKLNAVSINVTARNGMVYLSGTLYREFEIHEIVQMVQGIPGVTGVDISQLRLKNRSPERVSDILIQSRIKTLFTQSEIFGSFPNSLHTIYPVVIDGVAYLNGTAETEGQIQGAIALARSVGGVKAVVANVKILPKGYCC